MLKAWGRVTNLGDQTVMSREETARSVSASKEEASHSGPECGSGQGSDKYQTWMQGERRTCSHLISMAWLDQGGPLLPTYTLGSIQLFLLSSKTPLLITWT